MSKFKYLKPPKKQLKIKDHPCKDADCAGKFEEINALIARLEKGEGDAEDQAFGGRAITEMIILGKVLPPELVSTIFMAHELGLEDGINIVKADAAAAAVLQELMSKQPEEKDPLDINLKTWAGKGSKMAN